MSIKTVHEAIEWLLVASQRRRTATLTAAAVAALAGGLLIARLSFDANVLRLLPRQAPTVRSFEKFLSGFGSLDSLYVLFESQDSIGDHADLVDAYVAELRKAPEITSVDSALFEPGKDWSYLYDRELYLLGPGGAADALARFRSPGLDRELAHTRDLLSMPSTDVKAYVQQDPLGLLTLVRKRFDRQKGVIAFDPAQQGYVSPDGRGRLVIVKPAGEPFDTDFCKALFRRLEEVERAARATLAEGGDAQGVTIQAAGAYRVAIEAESVIRREATINAIDSFVLLLIIVVVVFRTPWMLVYGTVPLVLGAGLALGIAGLLQGRLSPATSGSAAMLFGLGIDGIVLLYMRFLEEREAGATPAEACRNMAGTGVSVMVAELTTVATFFALLFVDFPTLNELGALIGGGMLLTCFFTLVLLPALLARDPRTRGRTLTAAWLGRLVTRHRRAIVVAGAVATIALGAAATRLRVDMGLERLQAQTGSSNLERDLAARFSLPTDVLLVLNEGADLEPLVAADARLAEAFAAPAAAVAVSGSSLVLPTAESQRLVAGEMRRAGVSVDEVAANLRAAAARAGFRPDAFDPFVERLPRLLDPEARITYEGLVEHGLDPIVSRFVARKDGRYTAVTYLYPRQGTDPASLEATVAGVDPSLQLTGLPAINRELARRFPREFAKGVLLGTAAVTLIMFAVFRTVRHTLLALLPTFTGFVWSAGLLSLAGVELDLFSMFAAVTCIGIAVDYGIHLLYRYAVEGTEEVHEVLNRTGAPIMFACVTAVVGYGTLINSSYPPLRAFAIVSVVTLACCLVASLVLLPAILLYTRR